MSTNVSFTEGSTSSVWSARYSHSSAVFDNKLWVMGGIDSNHKNDVWFTTDGSSWTEVTTTSVWSVRHALTSAVFDNKLWVMGGYGGSNLNDVWFTTVWFFLD